MVIVLALDIDDTLFDSSETESVVWTYSKLFWQKLVKEISDITKRKGIEFRVAIVTAKSHPDELVYHALDTFSEYMDLGFPKSDRSHVTDDPELTFCYQNYKGGKKIVKLKSNGHFNSDNDVKRESGKSGVFILDTRKRFEFICKNGGSSVPSVKISDDNILEFGSDTLEEIKKLRANYLLTKTHALKSLLELYDIAESEAVILIDDRQSIVNDAEQHKFQSIRFETPRLETEHRKAKEENFRAEVMTRIFRAIALYTENEWTKFEEWECDATDTHAEFFDRDCLLIPEGIGLFNANGKNSGASSGRKESTTELTQPQYKNTN